MKDFEFKGNWKFKLSLPEFKKIYSTTDKSKKWKALSLELMSGSVPIRILDQRSYAPDPLIEQIRAVNLIIDNQNDILNGVLQACEQINSVYVEWCGVDTWVPQPFTINSLGELLRIEEIAILTEHKNGMAYLQFDCSYEGDSEHGLSFVMHEQRLIEFGGMLDLDYSKLYADLGSKVEFFRSNNIKNRELGKNMIHKPLPKYGKFKPWQLIETGEYFGKLLRAKKNEELISEIESSHWDINLRFPKLSNNLVDKAAYANNIEILGYLINQGGDFSNSMEQCINRGFHHTEAIKFLVESGASIDTFGYFGFTPLGNEIKKFARIVVRKEEYKQLEQERVEKALKEYQTIKKKINFYLSLGADPNFLNKDGATYKNIVDQSWTKHMIKQYNINQQVEELLFPNTH